MKKALIYDPYLDTMGGGERYILTFAVGLVKNGYAVDLAWNNPDAILEAEKRFNLDLSGIKINQQSYEDLSLSSGLIKRFNCTKNYDLTFWVSDGSIPFLFSKNNFIHFQVPFTHIGGNQLLNLAKISRTNKFIFNSAFTSAVVKKQLPLSSSVIIYPPIDIASFTPGKKENLILSVARFDSPSHAKRQDVLIDAFAQLYKQDKSYRLVLAGGLKGGEDFLESLRAKAGKLPVEIVPNPKFTDLQKLYSSAKIFWHAAGYEIDEVIDPEKVEHFGITTVEAMSAGAIPIVINRGGQREIITGETGYLVDSILEMVSDTLSLINSPEKMKFMAQKAIVRSKEFSVDNFYQKITDILPV